MMASATEQAAAMPTPTLDPSAHRKVRKGTRSCWECKRRKIKCIFPTSGESSCIFCQRRRIACIGQEIPESLARAKENNRGLGDRISRIEDALKDLLQRKETQIPGHGVQRPQEETRIPLSEPSDPAVLSVRAPPTPAKSLESYKPHLSLPEAVIPPVSNLADKDNGSSHSLLAACPTGNDLKILLPESLKTARYTLLVNTQPHSQLNVENLGASLAPEPCLGPSIHPIILVKSLIIFAITTQAPCEEFRGLSETLNVLSRRFVKAAVSWLATQDEAYSTIDTLVCIILEAVFETNSGNLRKAWVVYRKAIAVAQEMGLHRSPPPRLKQIDATLNVDPEFIWFRIVYMDRYLSLLLGLPPGTSDGSIGVGSLSPYEPPLGQFERQLNAIASVILKRNDRAFSSSEFITTKSIDEELLKVSSNMPANFWQPAEFHNISIGSPDNVLEAIRLAAHVYYYGLLIHLHLPYMMHGINNNIEHEYSKITCVNASREILSRFIAHRNFQPKSSCSRPVDFFALMAAMTLSLAHLDAHNRRAATNFLAHQRLSDRAMLDRVLQIMDLMRDSNKDLVMENGGKLIRQLLEIEANAASGGRYKTSTVGESEEEAEHGEAERRGELRLLIPYLGHIKITPQGLVSRDLRHENMVVGAYQMPQTDFSYQESVDSTFASVQHSSPMKIHESINNLQAIPHIAPCTNEILSPQNFSQNLHVEQGSANMYDWAFQGADVAFFDSLMRGYS